MNRPYIICLMSASIDGKITGEYVDTPEAVNASKDYEHINRFYSPQAWVNGRITVDENFTFYRKPKLKPHSDAIPHTDFFAVKDAENYIVAVDPHGKLGWEKNYIEYAGRPKAFVIEVLTEQVSNEYLAFLREMEISYIFAGTDKIDCVLLVQKLKEQFQIDTLKVSGGGVLNWSFAEAGLIDEISVVIAPVVDGNSESPTLFERLDAPFKQSIGFNVKSAEVTENGCVWLRYVSKENAAAISQRKD
ncbi:MAG: RibD family protein [Peptococcaceae bacterium]|nr:RibD family protein [Peptococcaceae bacterium]